MPPPRQLPGKIDPRLLILLSKSPNSLIGHQQLERQQLSLRAARIRDLAGKVATASTPAERDQFERELRALRASPISPLTTGVCLPLAETVGREQWVRKAEIHFSALLLFEGGAQDLADMDVVVRAQSGDIFSVWIPFSVVRPLAARPSLHYIELAFALQPDLGDVVGSAHTDIVSLHALGNRGKDVVVGVIDDAIDIYHPDFRDPGSGDTRILLLIDRNTGNEFDSAAINSEISPTSGMTPGVYAVVAHDPTGRIHGTGVAGCAVGNGEALVLAKKTVTNPFAGLTPGPGAAPEAGLIFVSYLEPFPEAPFGESPGVAADIQEIFSRAGAMPGAPACVINLSQSDDLGPHDGTTLLEKKIDSELLFPGRAVILSAGNSNDSGSHTSGTVSLGATTQLGLRYTSATSDPESNDAIEIWYSGSDEFKVRVTIPADAAKGGGGATLPDPLEAPWLEAVPASSSPEILRANLKEATLTGTGVKVSLSSLLADGRNGDNVIRMEILLSAGSRVPVDVWKIELEGKSVNVGTFHAWVDRNNKAYRNWTMPAAVNSVTLGCPSAATSAITVGSQPKVSAPPDVAFDSGRGYTRTGTLKPDLCTVGENVSVPLAESRANRVLGGGYHGDSGTSYSAPVVAGACALLFKCRGKSATWADLRGILESHATDILVVGPDPDSGFGEVRMTTACSDPTRTIDVWIRDEIGDNGDEPFTGPIFWRSPDITVLDRFGNPVAQPTHDPGRAWNSQLRVTVRNRGNRVARQTRVFLYWADPGTNIPYPNAWNSDGIFADDPAFVTPGNEAVVDVPANGQVDVTFAWAPPPPGNNLAGDDHYCLLVRLEHRDDPSFIMAGGFSSVSGRNNIALHNVHVQLLPQPTPPPPQPLPAGHGGGDGGHRHDPEFRSKFLVIGTNGVDGLYVRCDGIKGEVHLILPLAALPWRDATLIDRIGGRPPYEGPQTLDTFSHLVTLLGSTRVPQFTDVLGAARLKLHAGDAIITLGRRELFVPRLRLPRNIVMPCEIVVTTAQAGGESGWVHIGQLSDGKRVGGVSLELRPRDR